MMSTKPTKCKEEHKAFIDARLYKLGKAGNRHRGDTGRQRKDMNQMSQIEKKKHSFEEQMLLSIL